MRIWLRRLLLPVLAVFAIACLIELPLLGTTVFGDAVILWDTVFRAILAVPVLLYFYREDRVFRGKERLSVPAAAAYSAAGAALSLFLSALIGALGIPGAREASDALFTGPVWLQLLALLAASPLLEELFFRGVLYWRLKEILPMWAAMAAQAAAFGLYHWNPAQGICSGILALYLAWTMERTQTVKTPVLVHMAVNAAALFAAYLAE